MKNKIRYTCTGYKHTPESFKSYMVVINPDGYNHSYYRLDNLTRDENSEIGMICICNGKAKAEAEIKRIMRRKIVHDNQITYGYRLMNDNMVVYLQCKNIDNNASIKEKLELYKNIKRYFESNNYIITEYSYDTFELNGNYKAINGEHKEIKKELNTRPIKLKFVGERNKKNE